MEKYKLKLIKSPSHTTRVLDDTIVKLIESRRTNFVYVELVSDFKDCIDKRLFIPTKRFIGIDCNGEKWSSTSSHIFFT